jgi:hypothetical protein
MKLYVSYMHGNLKNASWGFGACQVTLDEPVVLSWDRMQLIAKDIERDEGEESKIVILTWHALDG